MSDPFSNTIIFQVKVTPLKEVESFCDKKLKCFICSESLTWHSEFVKNKGASKSSESSLR
jgi:hypothetical protein